MGDLRPRYDALHATVDTFTRHACCTPPGVSAAHHRVRSYVRHVLSTPVSAKPSPGHHLVKPRLGPRLRRNTKRRRGAGWEVLDRAYQVAVGTAAWLAWLPPLLARIAMGVTFTSTGWGKLHHLPKVTGFFMELGLPAPAFLADLVGATEFVCGLLVLIGLITRGAAILLIVVMAVAIVTARLHNVHGLADFLGLEELAYTLLFFWLVIAGPGRISLDYVIVRWFEGSRTPTEEKS
jgi:putative oxidoreductase